MFNKNGVSPVVATALLLVTVVVSVTSFQSWYNEFGSSLLTDIEGQSNGDSLLFIIESLYGDDLYFSSGTYQSLNSLKIVDSLSGAQVCLFDSNAQTDNFNSTSMILNFNDGTANDTSEFSHDITAEGGIDCSSEGVSGTGCFFDQTDDTIILEANTTFNVYPTRTVSLWLRSTVGNNQRPLGQGDTGAIAGNFEMRGNIIFEMINSSSGSQICTYPGGFATQNDTWHHVALVQNRESGGNSFIKAYLNGALVCDKNVGTISTTINTDFHIGSRTNKDVYYGGYMDEFSMYSKELTQGEVKTLYETRQALLYEEIVPKGTRGLDISNCNLVNGRTYSVVIITDKGTFAKELIKK